MHSCAPMANTVAHFNIKLIVCARIVTMHHYHYPFLQQLSNHMRTRSMNTRTHTHSRSGAHSVAHHSRRMSFDKRARIFNDCMHFPSSSLLLFFFSLFSFRSRTHSHAHTGAHGARAYGCACVCDVVFVCARGAPQKHIASRTEWNWSNEKFITI